MSDINQVNNFGSDSKTFDEGYAQTASFNENDQAQISISERDQEISEEKSINNNDFSKDSTDENQRDQTLCDISLRDLSELPFDIPEDSPILKLNISHNKFTKLPLSLHNLITLNATKNNLSNFLSDPDLSLNYPNIQTFDLSSNSLTIIPQAICKLSSLNSLILSKNNISQLSYPDDSFPNLLLLNLSFNDLKSFPESLPSSLLICNCRMNNIVSIPESIQHSLLKEIRLSGNFITEIPASICFPSLVTLELNLNHLISLSDLTICFPHLERINISHNFLVEMPKFPNSIVRVDISHNQIKEWNGFLSRYTNLKFIDISYNKFTKLPEIPEHIERFIAHHNSFSSKTLDFQGNEDLAQLSSSNLIGFEFEDNNLTEIPDFSLCKNAVRGFFRRNQISTIDIDRLPPSIQNLYLMQNQLTSLPPNISVLSDLQVLNLAGNVLCDLPDLSATRIKSLTISGSPLLSLPKLPSTLQSIFASSCSFQEIPPSIYECRELKYFDFSNNKISTIPTVHFPKGIQSVNLSHNKLRTFPHKFFPDSLETLELAFNQLEIIDLRFAHFNKALTVLDISFNNIQSMEMPNSGFPKLLVFKCQGNHNLSNSHAFINKSNCLEIVDESFTQLPALSYPLKRSIKIYANSSIEDINNMQVLKYDPINPKDIGYSVTDNYDSIFIDKTLIGMFSPIPQRGKVNTLINSSTILCAHYYPYLYSTICAQQRHINQAPNININQNNPTNENVNDLESNNNDNVANNAESNLENTIENNIENNVENNNDKANEENVNINNSENVELSNRETSVAVNVNQLFVELNKYLEKKCPNSCMGTIIKLHYIDNKVKSIGITHLGTNRVIVVKQDLKYQQLTMEHVGSNRSELETLRSSDVMELRLADSPTRAIGDSSVTYGMLKLPDISFYSVQENDYRIVIGSNSLFAKMTNEEIAQIAATTPNVDEAAFLITLKCRQYDSSASSVIIINLN